jgi:hypothetical protein
MSHSRVLWWCKSITLKLLFSTKILILSSIAAQGRLFRSFFYILYLKHFLFTNNLFRLKREVKKYRRGSGEKIDTHMYVHLWKENEKFHINPDDYTSTSWMNSISIRAPIKHHSTLFSPSSSLLTVLKWEHESIPSDSDWQVKLRREFCVKVKLHSTSYYYFTRIFLIDFHRS